MYDISNCQKEIVVYVLAKIINGLCESFVGGNKNLMEGRLIMAK